MMKSLIDLLHTEEVSPIKDLEYFIKFFLYTVDKLKEIRVV